MGSLLLDHERLVRSVSHDGLRPEHLLPYARQIDVEHPEYFPSLGMTPCDYAAGMAGAGLTIDEAVAAGEMSAAEGRYLQGHASRADLIELGLSREEIEAIVEDQRARAGASSG